MELQSKPLIRALRGSYKVSVLTGCVRIKRVDFRENVRAFFPRDTANCP